MSYQWASAGMGLKFLRNFRKKGGMMASLLLCAFLLMGCASSPDDVHNDPIEPFNRAMFSINEGIESVVIRPAATVYRTIIPDPIRYNVRSFLDNLRSPVILVNDLLQGELSRAGITLARFLINSTLGFAGIVDLASEIGLESHSEDFGQTLAVWGVDEGAYLVLPVLGPSNPRDAIGRLVDAFIDPFNHYASNVDKEWMIYARTGTDAVDSYARSMDRLDQIRASSVDYYASIRSTYRQFRDAAITNGASASGSAYEEFENEE